MKQARKMMALWCQRKRYTGGVLQIQHHFANTGIKSGIQKTKTTPFPEHTSEQFAPLDLCQQAPPEDIHSQNPHAYAKQQPGHGGCTTRSQGGGAQRAVVHLPKRVSMESKGTLAEAGAAGLGV